MSNHLAIATATAALRQILSKAARETIAGADAAPGRPKEIGTPPPDPETVIFLYQAAPNPSWRNADLPTRRGDGTLVQRPQVPLDLYYLLIFYGDEANLEPQRLMGSAVSALHAQPILTKDVIRDAIGADANLANSDLDRQAESVKFSPIALNLEELSKLWSVFFQVPYALSMAYQASVVFIEAQATPQQALPVDHPLIYAKTLRQPTIEAVESSKGTDHAIAVGDTLVVRGKSLKGEPTQVRVGDAVVEIDKPKDTAIELALKSPPFPAGALRAGVQGVQVLHPTLMGDPETLHRGVESNVAAFVLRPSIKKTGSNYDITVASDKTSITVEFAHDVGKAQRTALLLNEFDPPADRAPHAYRFDGPPNNGITSDTVEATDTIAFAISDVATGDYLTRVQVDGAESVLEMDGGKYSKPKVST
jgi:hypothetical protein